MTEQEIKQMLDQLAEYRTKIATLEIEKQSVVEQAVAELREREQSILTDEQKAGLAEIHRQIEEVEMGVSFEFVGKKEDAELNAAILENKIKDAVIQAGASIKGAHVTCQFVRPSPKINAKGLELALKKFDGLEDFVEPGQPTTRIVWNKS